MWNELKNEMNKEYFKKLELFITEERLKYNVYPKEEDVYNAFKYCDYSNVSTVLIGQDPYHNKNQANGLSFSVSEGVKHPPSLRNIFKELKNDLNIETPISGDLSKWAKQGMLLLNTYLTVRENSPLSHSRIGWEKFTKEVIKLLNNRDKKIVFVLLGGFAQKYEKYITNKNHIIIKTSHPSPLSAYRGFNGSKIFTSINNNLDIKIDFKL